MWSTFSFAATELSYAGMCTLKVKGARKALFAILQHIMHNELIFYLKNPQTSNSIRHHRNKFTLEVTLSIVSLES